MTIEMINEPGQGPFIWPEAPSSFKPWAKEQYDEGQLMQESKRSAREEPSRAWPDREVGQSFRQQAKDRMKKVRAKGGT